MSPSKSLDESSQSGSEGSGADDSEDEENEREAVHGPRTFLAIPISQKDNSRTRDIMSKTVGKLVEAAAAGNKERKRLAAEQAQSDRLSRSVSVRSSVKEISKTSKFSVLVTDDDDDDEVSFQSRYKHTTSVSVDAQLNYLDSILHHRWRDVSH